jgi:hypothetical protein
MRTLDLPGGCHTRPASRQDAGFIACGRVVRAGARSASHRGFTLVSTEHALQPRSGGARRIAQPAAIRSQCASSRPRVSVSQSEASTCELCPQTFRERKSYSTTLDCFSSSRASSYPARQPGRTSSRNRKPFEPSLDCASSFHARADEAGSADDVTGHSVEGIAGSVEGVAGSVEGTAGRAECLEARFARVEAAALLLELGLPTVPTDNTGRLAVAWSAYTAWHKERGGR